MTTGPENPQPDPTQPYGQVPPPPAAATAAASPTPGYRATSSRASRPARTA